jgi:hypothetical protein
MIRLLYSGSKVKLAFRQKPYILRDGITYGTTLKLVGIQVVALNSSAGVDALVTWMTLMLLSCSVKPKGSSPVTLL